MKGRGGDARIRSAPRARRRLRGLTCGTTATAEGEVNRLVRLVDDQPLVKTDTAEPGIRSPVIPGTGPIRETTPQHRL